MDETKKKDFFEWLEEKKMRQVLFCVGSIVVILGAFVFLRNKIAERNSYLYSVKEDKDFVRYVEDAYTKDNVLYVTGWGFYKNIDSSTDEIQVFLRNVDDEEDVVWLDVTDIEREDVAGYFDSQIDYSQSGFCATLSLDKLDLTQKDYEIFVKITYGVERTDDSKTEEKIFKKMRSHTVSSKRYICDGEFTALKSGKVNQMETTMSEQLNMIFDEGNLLIYIEEADLYVYQYGKKLYWVAGEKFKFKEDGETYVYFRLYTTSVDKLPAKRLDGGKDFDSLGFSFEEEEWLKEETYPYHVVERDIPTDYPISSIFTGCRYTDGSEWLWMKYINLDIQELNENN